MHMLCLFISYLSNSVWCTVSSTWLLYREHVLPRHRWLGCCPDKQDGRWGWWDMDSSYCMAKQCRIPKHGCWRWQTRSEWASKRERERETTWVRVQMRINVKYIIYSKNSNTLITLHRCTKTLHWTLPKHIKATVSGHSGRHVQCV